MKKIFFELVVVFLVVASLGGFYTLKSNHEIGRKKVAQIVVSNHLDHLISIRIALELANEISTNKRTPEILKIRGYEAQRAINVLDDMRKHLIVFKKFPIKEFDENLLNLKDDFNKGDPYLAVMRLAELIQFVLDKSERA